MYLINGTFLQGGKYKIVRHISSGGFGNTYEGLDVGLNKRVAIKEFFVKDFCVRDTETTQVTITTPTKAPLIEHLKQKFIEEARAIAAMEHENIVKVQALFEENDTAYYVMDYIDGESVGNIIKHRGALPESEALPIILKVADALGYMHSQNRYHLDIKPANIMLRRDGKVVLIDFGTSKQYAEVDGTNTTTLAPCYTPGYAPAEQMNPSHTAYTAATDIYALGATLYKMLTGVTPPSAIALLNEDETLSPLSSEISENVRECVERAMVPQRGKRTPNIAAFKAALDDRAGEKEPAPKPARTASSRGIIGVAAAIILVLVGVIIAISTAKDGSTAPPPSPTPDMPEVVAENDESANLEQTVEPDEEKELKQEPVYYVITYNMFVRTGPGLSYEPLYSPYSDFDSNNTNGVVVYTGTVVEALEERNGFVRARQTSENYDRDDWGEGWISKKHMQRR